MKAVFKHELSSYFNSLSGYVFGAFLLLFAGIYTTMYNIKSAVTNFEYVLGDMSFVFLIIVPILTMRVLAEERRQKTDQLLYSLPLTMTHVVLGKYAALLVMYLVPVLILCIYPVILSLFGNVYLPASFGTAIGFYFLGATLIAIGMFISSVTESQAVAAGLCFVVMLINLFISTFAGYLSNSAMVSLAAFAIVILLLGVIIWRMTKNGALALIVSGVLEIGLCALYLMDSTKFEGLFASIVTELSLFSRFYGMVEGVFDLTTLVYYASIIAVFLFLSIQSMEKRRWSE